jgi:hypothetical protein
MEKWWIIEGPLESRGSAVRTYVTGTCGERARDAVWGTESEEAALFSTEREARVFMRKYGIADEYGTPRPVPRVPKRRQ